MMLKHLDLSWNGFGNEGALAMGEALKFNNTLVYLNLNNNRLTNEGVSLLCRGLEFNDTLRVLLVGCQSCAVLSEHAIRLQINCKVTLYSHPPVAGLQLCNSRGSTGLG